MIKRDTLIKFINKTIGYDLIAKAQEKDERLNGVQILGGEDVEVVTLGVTLNEEFLKKAVADKSNFCIFHHGLDFSTYNSRLSMSLQKRLKLVIKNDITISGFHYALDAHKTLGNNAQIINKLGAKIIDTLYEEWGFVAEFEKPIPTKALQKRCDDLFNREILPFIVNDHAVKKIGVVSGGAVPYPNHLEELKEKEIQVYISGETKESTPHKLLEEGISYFICGHYSTEVFGIKALGEKIKKEFRDRIVVEFIDVPNPI